MCFPIYAGGVMAFKAKATRKEYLERKEIILNMILDCESMYQICRYAAETWGYSRRQVERFITEINKDLAKRSTQNFESKISEAIKRTKRLMRRCLKEGDKQTAARLLKELHDLEGIKTVRVEHSGKIDSDVTVKEDYSKLTVEELLTLKELIQKTK